MPDGAIKANPAYVEEDHINAFTRAFNIAYPPVEPGTFPVKYDEVITKSRETDEGFQVNRWLCVGGPMDEGEGIAKVLKLKKGRGKNSIEVLVPINPDNFTVEAGGKIYVYVFDGLQYNCIE